MEQFLGFRNFRQFERGLQRHQAAIGLLNDLRFCQIPDAGKVHLICLLLLSVRLDHVLPNNSTKLEQLIGAADSTGLSGFADFVAFTQVE